MVHGIATPVCALARNDVALFYNYFFTGFFWLPPVYI